MGPIPTLGSYLNISFNPVLTDISALNSLTEVGPAYVNGFLAINNNNDLPAINGLDLITETGSYFFLGSNPAMTAVNGLNGLTTVNGDFEIAGNAVLNDLDAFTSLTTVAGIFSIDNNPQLTNVLDFQNLASVGGTLTIVSNASLTDCAAEGICDFLAGTGAASISNNAAGCNSVAEVEADCAAAPVELTFFKGTRENKQVMLTWQTASEKNNDHFLVEHGQNGNQFQTLGRVTGNGTSSASNNYHFQHRQPAKGINYYRLKQVDFDGKFEYSPLVSVFFENEEPEIFPNPTTGPVWLKGESQGRRTARVTDLAGRVVLEKDLSESSLIDLFGQPSGVYLIEIQTDDRKSVKRVVKE
jgi:hypothetical protein